MRLSFANFFSYFNWHFADSLAEYSTAIRYASHIAHPQKLTHVHTHVRTHTEPTPPLHILIQPPFPLLAPENEMKTFLWKRLRNALESMENVEELYVPVMIREIMQIIAWYDLYK